MATERSRKRREEQKKRLDESELSAQEIMALARQHADAEGYGHTSMGMQSPETAIPFSMQIAQMLSGIQGSANNYLDSAKAYHADLMGETKQRLGMMLGAPGQFFQQGHPAVDRVLDTVTGFDPSTMADPARAWANSLVNSLSGGPTMGQPASPPTLSPQVQEARQRGMAQQGAAIHQTTALQDGKVPQANTAATVMPLLAMLAEGGTAGPTIANAAQLPAATGAAGGTGVPTTGRPVGGQLPFAQPQMPPVPTMQQGVEMQMQRQGIGLTPQQEALPYLSGYPFTPSQGQFATPHNPQPGTNPGGVLQQGGGIGGWFKNNVDMSALLHAMAGAGAALGGEGSVGAALGNWAQNAIRTQNYQKLLERQEMFGQGGQDGSKGPFFQGLAATSLAGLTPEDINSALMLQLKEQELNRKAEGQPMMTLTGPNGEQLYLTHAQAADYLQKMQSEGRRQDVRIGDRVFNLSPKEAADLYVKTNDPRYLMEFFGQQVALSASDVARIAAGQEGVARSDDRRSADMSVKAADAVRKTNSMLLMELAMADNSEQRIKVGNKLVEVVTAQLQAHHGNPNIQFLKDPNTGMTGWYDASSSPPRFLISWEAMQQYMNQE